MWAVCTMPCVTCVARPPRGCAEDCPLESYVLSEAERQFLQELNDRGVRFLVVGASAAILQGANIGTKDVDLWFESTADDRIGEAVRAVGGIWASGSFGMRPPAIGGESLGDRFDVVTHMHGMRDFQSEYGDAVQANVDGVLLRLLPLARIVASKRAAGRTKDLAQLPALEETLAAMDGDNDDADP